jgi:hypothetical protein
MLLHRTIPSCRRWFASLLGGLLLTSVICSPAWAEGGASIAAAPAVVYGQQEFGSLSQGPNENGCVPLYRSWWTLPVMTGDEVTVDWETQDSNVYLHLYPPGTTDFTFPQTNPVAESFLNDNLKAELTYLAPQTGSLPLEFFANSDCGVVPGPYAFTAYVIHSVRLFIAHRGRLPLSGTMAVGVHTPVGEPISDPNLQVMLEIKSRGHWYTAGTATPVNGLANIAFRLSAKLRHQHVSLRAVAHGSAYRAASSSAMRVRVG